MTEAIGAALDRIVERAADVRRAFEPGSLPAQDDVALAQRPPDVTLDPLACVPPPGGYFVVRDARGATQYSGDGSFRIAGGTLVDERGRVPLGVAPGSTQLAPLALDPLDAHLGRVQALRIDARGTLAYDRTTIDPRNGRRQTQTVAVGRLALARFPAGTRLEPRPDGSSSAPPGVVPHVATPGDDGFSPLQTMRRSRSAIDLDASLARLKEAYVALDALAAAETARGKFSKTAMDLLK